MNLLIDNYDSFSYNLVQLVGGLDPDIRVIRNDQVTVEDIRRMRPDHLFLSRDPAVPLKRGYVSRRCGSWRTRYLFWGVFGTSGHL